MNAWLIVNEWMNEWMNKWMNEWINEWLNEWMCCSPSIIFKRMSQDFWSWFKETTDVPWRSQDLISRVLLMTQKPSFNVSVNSKPDHPPPPLLGNFLSLLDWLVRSLNTQMIIILRQFCLQLILKRPSTQLISAFCFQSSSLLASVRILFNG